jgi:ABC-type lipoprotein release transport system permease subunit
MKEFKFSYRFLALGVWYGGNMTVTSSTEHAARMLVTSDISIFGISNIDASTLDLVFIPDELTKVEKLDIRKKMIKNMQDRLQDAEKNKELYSKSLYNQIKNNLKKHIAKTSQLDLFD